MQWLGLGAYGMWFAFVRCRQELAHDRMIPLVTAPRVRHCLAAANAVTLKTRAPLNESKESTGENPRLVLPRAENLGFYSQRAGAATSAATVLSQMCKFTLCSGHFQVVAAVRAFQLYKI